MKKKHKNLPVGLLAIAMVLTALPMSACAEGSGNQVTNLALNKNFLQYWIGSDDSLGGDAEPQDTKKPDDSPFTVRDSETISVNLKGAGNIYDDAKSGNRLTDGYIVTDPAHNTFDAGWVGTPWNDSSKTRGKYVNAYRNDSRNMILDLERVSNVNRLSLHMGDSAAYGITTPLYVTYYLADNAEGPYYLAGTCYANSEGANYPNMAKKDPNPVVTQTVDGEPEPAMDHWYFDVDDLNLNARYVRVCFDMNVWAFIDELQVFGSETPDPSAPALSGDVWKPEVTYDAYATSGSSDVTDNHEYLAYTGYYKTGTAADGSVNVGITQKTEDEFLKTIAYVDPTGKPTDWLFDQITISGHGVTKTGRFETVRSDVANPSAASNYATVDDWTQWLDHIFDENIEDEKDAATKGKAVNLDALEAAAGRVKAALGDANAKVKVHISIVPPVYNQTQWCTAAQAISMRLSIPGAIDFTLKGNGYNVDQTVAARMSAMDWYLDEIIRRFHEKDYRNIELEGFYYHDEIIRSTGDTAAGQTITEINALIHEKGYDSYWIPFFQAEGYKKWKDFGFDYAIMQPNYVFDANASKTRIDDCAALSKKYGLGIEMEYNGTGAAQLPKFKEYLQKGKTVGYQTEESRMAWYMGTWDLPKLATDSANRYLYDAIYSYINGRTPVLEPNALSGKTITIQAPADPTYAINLQTNAKNLQDANAIASTTLTDGIYGQTWDGVISDSNPIIAFNSATAGPFEITADMGSYYKFSHVYFDLFTYKSAGVGIPEAVKFYVSNDGVNWVEIGSVDTATTSIVMSNESLTRELYSLKVSGESVGRYLKAEFAKGLNTSDASQAGKRWSWISFDEFGATAVETGA